MTDAKDAGTGGPDAAQREKSTWWEKSVEYAFIMEGARKNVFKLAAPLAGHAERAGDGVFSASSRIVLIEFKRSAAEFVDERVKYSDWGAAREDLAAHSACHFFVYGEGAHLLKLKACRYFPEASKEDGQPDFGQGISALQVLGLGVTPEEFLRYLARLLLYKEENKSGDAASSLAEAVVLGLTDTGALVVVTMSEYMRCIESDIKAKLTQLKSQFALDKQTADTGRQAREAARAQADADDGAENSRSNRLTWGRRG